MLASFLSEPMLNTFGIIKSKAVGVYRRATNHQISTPSRGGVVGGLT